MNPEARDAADSSGFECDVVTRRNALHQRVELFSCVAAPAHALLCAHGGSHPGDRRPIFRIERMDHDDVTRAFRATHQPSLSFSMNPDCDVEGNSQSSVSGVI